MVSEAKIQKDCSLDSNIDRQLEENCLRMKVSIITFSYVKTVTLGLILFCSFVGAILLYNFKKIRIMVLYTSAQCLRDATHIYVQDEHGREKIEEIRTLQGGKKQFSFLKVRYWITQDLHFFPVRYDPTKEANLSQIASSGLNENEVCTSKQIYGPNQHTVDTPNYFQYMISVIFTPLYLLQYFSVFILVLQGVYLLGIILVILSMITTSGNYIALYLSNKKIKEIAEKTHPVRVLRQDRIQVIDSREIVPGDVLIVQNTEIPCDAVLIQGDAYMNEESLTGQSVPVAKLMIKELTENIPDQSTLFQGTMNIQYVQNTKALAIATGFTTRKGQIQKKIMHRIAQQPDFFKQAVWFLAFSGSLSVIVFLCTLKIKLNADIDRSLVWLGLINVVLNAVFPALPIYFTMAYSWSIYRLKKDNILTTMPEKTVESNRLKISCFDKTGTLTENSISLDKVYLYEKKFREIEKVNEQSDIYRIAQMLLGTCHSVRKVGDDHLGDEVDLRTYHASKFIKVDCSGQVYTSHNGQYECEVLKVHQFESRYQSMSVLVHDRKSQKFYCFSKGAPQKMMVVSTDQIPKYHQFVAKLSLNGLRTIAISYKEVTVQEAIKYKDCERQKFFQESRLIGLVTFENSLKIDTPATVSELKDAGIDCKMITGDGIFIAVQTAVRAGIIHSKEMILVIEGRKQLSNAQIDGLILRKTPSGYKKESVKIALSDSNQLQDLVVALDNEYLDMNPPISLLISARVFARIAPQSKSKIIKLLKQNLIKEWQSRFFKARLFGQGRFKISMIGDGANDLLAIKAADVGIGISNSDASYGAAFSVKELSQIINIIKQGKCTTQNIIENVRYFLVVGYLNISMNIFCATEATILGDAMSSYMNFLMITILPVISAYSKPNPSSKLTKYRVKDNFLGFESHLLTWGNSIMLILGLVCGFFYITSLQNYVPNPKPHWSIEEGFNASCQLVTSMYLLLGVPLASGIILIHKSGPVKNPIYKNKVLIVIVTINFIVMGVFYILNFQLVGVFETVALPSKTSLFVLFIISVLSQAGAFTYTYFISRYMDSNYKFESINPDKQKKNKITETNLETGLFD